MGLPCTEPEDSLTHPGTRWLLRPVPEWGLGDPSGHAEFAVPARRPSEVNSQQLEEQTWNSGRHQGQPGFGVSRERRVLPGQRRLTAPIPRDVRSGCVPSRSLPMHGTARTDLLWALAYTGPSKRMMPFSAFSSVLASTP